RTGPTAEAKVQPSSTVPARKPAPNEEAGAPFLIRQNLLQAFCQLGVAEVRAYERLQRFKTLAVRPDLHAAQLWQGAKLNLVGQWDVWTRPVISLSRIVCNISADRLVQPVAERPAEALHDGGQPGDRILRAGRGRTL